jgi:molybdopterin-guanine dinucleotide biosynthesis protein B
MNDRTTMNMNTSAKFQVPILGFVASSGTGKTSLLKEVIQQLDQAGLRISVIKQARDDFDLDQPGKDSYELRKAGVECLLLASERQDAMVIERLEPQEPALAELLPLLDLDALDLILVEGFSDSRIPKIELIRQAGTTPRYLHDPTVIALAVATPQVLEPQANHLKQLDLNQPTEVVAFVLAWLKQQLS